MKPQPYRLTFAPSPSLKPDVNAVLARQFQNADQMFEILFRSAGEGVTVAPLVVQPSVNGFLSYKFSTATTAPPTNSQVRFDAAYPYSAVTKVFVNDSTSEGVDMHNALMLQTSGTTLYVQADTDHTKFARFVTTGAPIGHSGYVEFPVSWVTDGGSALGTGALAVQVGFIGGGGGGVGPPGPPGPPGPTGPPGPAPTGTGYAHVTGSVLDPAVPSIPQADVTGLTAALAGKASTTHHVTHEPGGSDALTALDAGILTTGILPDARLSANIAHRDQSNAFAQGNTMLAPAALSFSDMSQPLDLKTFRVITSGQKLFVVAVDDSGVILTTAFTIGRDGFVQAITPAAGDNSTKIATTAFVRGSTLANVVLSTVTGAQPAFVPGTAAYTIINWNGAADAIFAGLAGGVKGQIVTFNNRSTTTVAYFTFNDPSAAAGNRLLPIVQSGPTPIAQGGFITFAYDGNFWNLIGHEQGVWITQPFSAANFTASGPMTWTVAAINVTAQSYKIVGNTLHYILNVSSTTIGGTADIELRAATPYVAAITNSTPAQVLSPGLPSTLSVGGPVAAQTYLRFFSNLNGAAWGLGNTAIARGAWEFPVN